MLLVREKWIDNAKGIAILLVMLGHVGGGLDDVFPFDFVYGIHLVMFFLISGYTNRKKKVDLVFINSRFRRLMVPYFVTCLAVTLSDILNSRFIYYDGIIATITAIVRNDLLRSFFASGSITEFGPIDIGTRIGAIWFLPALFFASIIFQLLINITEKSFHLGVISAGLAILGTISARFIWLPFSIQSAMMAVFFIWIGYEVRKRELLSNLKWYHYLFAQILFLLGIFGGYCNIGFASGKINDLVLSVITGLSGCLIIYLISILDRHGKVLEYFGRHSLVILCTHLFMLETRIRCMLSFMDTLGIYGKHKRGLALIVLEIGFAVVLSVAVELVKKYGGRLNENLYRVIVSGEESRDVTTDIAKGIFIVAMIIGHFSIDKGLRTVIFSCHMIAFVFFSGYFYKASRSFGKTIKRMLKTFLVPYGICVICEMFLNFKQWSPEFFRDTLVQYVFGMSFSKRILTGIPSVGPVYFILLLFVVRVIYMLIDRYFKREAVRWIVVIAVSLAGVILGRYGLWLPWSIDVALYSVVFYKLGYEFRKGNLLKFVLNNHIIYFAITPLWVFMIYRGGMEIAGRDYGEYGLVVLGSLSGVLTVIKLSDYISCHLPICRTLLKIAGEAAILIVIVHKLFHDLIISALANWLNNEGCVFMLLCTTVQIAAGILLYLIRKTLKIKLSR